MAHRSKIYRRILPIAVILVGAVLLVIGILAGMDYVTRTQNGPTVPIATQTITADTANPSEKVPTPISNNYSVPSNQPRVINIPSLNVTAYVQRVGVTADGSMATPNSINFTGWFVNSVAPGDKGLSIINGHVSGKYAPGVFKHINSLKVSDTVRVQMGDLSWRNFSIVSVEQYDVAKASGPLYSQDPSIASELHLITCGGPFDTTAQEYGKRTIVVAKYIMQ